MQIHKFYFELTSYTLYIYKCQTYLISKGFFSIGPWVQSQKKLSTLSLESEHYGYRSYYWQSLGSCYQYWGKKREKGTNTRRVSGRICWSQVCGEFFNPFEKNEKIQFSIKECQIELMHWEGMLFSTKIQLFGWMHSCQTEEFLYQFFLFKKGNYRNFFVSFCQCVFFCKTRRNYWQMAIYDPLFDQTFQKQFSTP